MSSWGSSLLSPTLTNRKIFFPTMGKSSTSSLDPTPAVVAAAEQQQQQQQQQYQRRRLYRRRIRRLRLRPCTIVLLVLLAIVGIMKISQRTRTETEGHDETITIPNNHKHKYGTSFTTSDKGTSIMEEGDGLPSNFLVRQPIKESQKTVGISNGSPNDANTTSQTKTPTKSTAIPSIATSTTIIPSMTVNSENPYYGWQPDYDNDTDHSHAIPTQSHENQIIKREEQCSWRVCFIPTRKGPRKVEAIQRKLNCTKYCRESLEDFINPPPRPQQSSTSSLLSSAQPTLSQDHQQQQWIPDVTMLSRMRQEGKDSMGRPWPPPLSVEFCDDLGMEKEHSPDFNKLLLDKVPIRVRPTPTNNNRDDTNTTTTTATNPTPKVLCMIYSMEPNHPTNIRAMRETWASYCDGFVVFSTKDDPRTPAIVIPHIGPEGYNNMWQKVRSIWKFVGTYYLDDFDFFFLGGEDLFVIPQNLKGYLQELLEQNQTRTADDDFFLGRRFHGPDSIGYFNSGGSGYVLSRGALRKYIQLGFDHPDCSPTARTSAEDVMMAQCLDKVFQIGLIDTRDSELRERFHPFSPEKHYQWRPREGDWYTQYTRDWPQLLDEKCCSPHSISFHYIKQPAMVRHLHALIHSCHNGKEEVKVNQ